MKTKLKTWIRNKNNRGKLQTFSNRSGGKKLLAHKPSDFSSIRQ